MPANYLKLISRDLSIFRQCSLKVQRQVWVMDKGTLRKHLSSVLDSYGQEKCVVRRHSSIEGVQLAPVGGGGGLERAEKESEEDLSAAGQSSRSNQTTATKKIVNSKKNSKANAIQARKEASKKAMITMATGAALAAVVDVVDNKTCNQGEYCEENLQQFTVCAKLSAITSRCITPSFERYARGMPILGSFHACVLAVSHGVSRPRGARVV